LARRRNLASGDALKIAYKLIPTMSESPSEVRPLPLIKPSSQSRVLLAFGSEATVLLDGQDTGGKLTSLIEVTPPGVGPPPHYHDREDEWFYILEGTVSFFANGEWRDAKPGDMVFAPRHSVHAFKNNTSLPTRMLIQLSPSGFENFFAEAALEFAKPEGPDMNRAVEIANSYGIHFVQV
jgi:quercetin dioxygenase-like cupin family protein